MIQQGQVFRLRARGAEGASLWAYRYRVAGRGSARLQVGGFASRSEAQRALQNKLARLGPYGRAATITLGEWVEEYLQNHAGERVDFRNFNRRHWKPVQRSLGIEPLRDLYDLRHTYATFALRAGVPVFAVSRFMGTSIAMIDLHYGHLAVDSYQHAVSLLDALALERAVDAGWTPARWPVTPRGDSVSSPRGGRSRRVVDARWTSRPDTSTSSRVRKG